MSTTNKAQIALVVTALAVVLTGVTLGWETNTSVWVGSGAGAYAAALVAWGGNSE